MLFDLHNPITCAIIKKNGKELLMETKRFKPLVDRLFYWILFSILILLLIPTVLSFFEIGALLIMLPVDLFTLYFVISPLFGYVELREEGLFIKYGFFLKREIPYNKIRGVEKGHSIISTSFYSLKCALDHLVVKYNRFDDTFISVVGNDELMEELKQRMSA